MATPPKDLKSAYMSRDEFETLLRTYENSEHVTGTPTSTDDQVETLAYAPNNLLENLPWGNARDEDEKPDFAAITRSLATGG